MKVTAGQHPLGEPAACSPSKFSKTQLSETPIRICTMVKSSGLPAGHNHL